MMLGHVLYNRCNNNNDSFHSNPRMALLTCRLMVKRRVALAGWCFALRSNCQVSEQ